MSAISRGKIEEQLVVFNLHDQVYGVDIASVIEIIRIEAITKVPGSPAFIEGIINLRGKVIPVMDLCTRFSLPPSEVTDSTRVIIVEAEVTIGIIVNSVSEVLRLTESNIEPIPSIITGSSANALRGIALIDNRMVTLLDLGKLIYEEERQELQGLDC